MYVLIFSLLFLVFSHVFLAFEGLCSEFLQPEHTEKVTQSWPRVPGDLTEKKKQYSKHCFEN